MNRLLSGQKLRPHGASRAQAGETRDRGRKQRETEGFLNCLAGCSPG